MNNLQEKKKSKNKKRRGWLFEEKRKKIARLNFPERHKKVKLFPKERNIELTERKLKRWFNNTPELDIYGPYSSARVNERANKELPCAWVELATVRSRAEHCTTEPPGLQLKEMIMVMSVQQQKENTRHIWIWKQDHTSVLQTLYSTTIRNNFQLVLAETVWPWTTACFDILDKWLSHIVVQDYTLGTYYLVIFSS